MFFKMITLLATVALLCTGMAAPSIGPAPYVVDTTHDDAPTGNLTANITHTIASHGSNIGTHRGLQCKNPTYGWGVVSSMQSDISYLNKKEGYTEFGWQVGGGYCTRVACEEDAGIYVCNDNEYDIWVYYSTMAAYAQYIIDYNDTTQTPCSWMEKNVENSGLDLQVAWGQAFDKRGFNVIAGIKEWTSC